MTEIIDTDADREYISFGDCVIRSRISLFRNCTGFFFPSRMSVTDSRRFALYISDRMRNVSDEWIAHHSDKMSNDEFDYFRDRGVLPADYSHLTVPVPFYTGRDEVSLFFLNREGIELRRSSAEFDPFHSAQILIESDKQLEKIFSYAVSLRYGYLNSHWSRTGAGIEAEVLLSLAALNRTEEGNRLLKIAAAENFRIEPYICPVLNEQVSGLLSVSTTSLNGETEIQMLQRFSKNLGTIVKMERLKRREWKESQVEQIRERYREALERINTSVKITLAESYRLLEVIRTAVLAGIADYSCSTLNRLFDFLKESYLIRCQSRFSDPAGPVVYDRLRACLLKDIFCGKAEVMCFKD